MEAPPTHNDGRDLRLLAALRGVSFLGDFTAMTALYLRLAPLHHAWAIAALAVAGSLPLVALAPVAGTVVDRTPAKALLAWLGLAEAAVCVALGLCHGLVATILLMLALSSLVAFSGPGYSALVPVAAGEGQIARAQGLIQSTQGVASVVGPVLGGLLVGAAGQTWPLLVDAASFAVAAVATTTLRRDRRPGPAATIAEAEARGQWMAGVRLVMGDAILRPVEIVVAVFMLGLGMVNVAEVFFITQTLHGTATDYGLVGTAFGAGLVVGSILAQRLSQAEADLVRVVVVTVTAIGALIGAIGLVSEVGLVYPFLGVAGVAVGAANVAAITLFTVRSPEHLRGRVFAAVGGIITAAEIGATGLGGLVLTVLAPRTVFQVGGLAAVATTLVLGPMALRAARRAAPVAA